MSETRDDFGDDEAVTYWKPEVGDSIRGRLESIDSVPDKYNAGKTSMLVMIRAESGGLYSWFAPTAARRTLTERFSAGVLKIGGPIGIKRKEDVGTRNGAMKMFSIIPKPTQEDAQAKAAKVIEAERAALDEGQLELPEPPRARKPAQPRGARPVESRAETAADGFEDDIPF